MSSPDRSLAVDIGNSGMKAGFYLRDVLQPPIRRFPPGDWDGIDRMATNLGVKNIIYSTVANVPSERWTDKWKGRGIFVCTLDRSRPLPFVSDYQSPETLGEDRIAAVAGTFGLLDTARLIVDAGSCVTLDLVDGHGRYRGGNISPGVAMRLRAMHERTRRLPLVEAGEVDGEVGRSTTEALRHGGQLGVVFEVEGLYRRLSSDHPGLRLVLTGGDASHLISHFSIPVYHYPDLVLRGLHQILSAYVNETL